MLHEHRLAAEVLLDRCERTGKTGCRLPVDEPGAESPAASVADSLPSRLVTLPLGQDRCFQHARGAQRLEAVEQERAIRNRKQVSTAAKVSWTAAIVACPPGHDEGLCNLHTLSNG